MNHHDISSPHPNTEHDTTSELSTEHNKTLPEHQTPNTSKHNPNTFRNGTPNKTMHTNTRLPNHKYCSFPPLILRRAQKKAMGATLNSINNFPHTTPE